MTLMYRTTVFRTDSVTSNAFQYKPGNSDMSLLLTVLRGYVLPLLRVHRLRLSILFAGVFIPLYLSLIHI